MTRDWTEELTAYIDGELSETDAKAVEVELQKNPQLRALEQKLRRTVTLMAQLPAPAPSQQLRRAVLDRIDEPTLLEKLKALLSPVRLSAVGLVAAAVVAAIVVWPRPKDHGTFDEEALFLAQNMEVLEDMEVLGLESPEDLDVVARLDELEAKP